MTQREMELMRALTAAQAALWDVVDDDYNAREVLATMIAEIVVLHEQMRGAR